MSLTTEANVQDVATVRRLVAERAESLVALLEPDVRRLIQTNRFHFEEGKPFPKCSDLAAALNLIEDAFGRKANSEGLSIAPGDARFTIGGF